MGTAEEKAPVEDGGVLDASVLASVGFPGTMVSVSVPRGGLLEDTMVEISPSSFVNVCEVDLLGDLVGGASP